MVSTDPARAPQRQPQAAVPLGASQAEGRSLWRRVSWSEQAIEDLETIVTDPAVRDQLWDNAEEILHDIPPGWRPRCVELGDAGAAAEVMWHRGVHDEAWLPEEADVPREEADGPEFYFLFYQQQSSGLGLEVLAIRSIRQAARRWERVGRNQLIRRVCHPKRRLPWWLPG